MPKNRVFIFHTNPSVIVGLTGILQNEFSSMEGMNLEIESESKLELFELKALDRPYDLIIADGCFQDRNSEHISKLLKAKPDSTVIVMGRKAQGSKVHQLGKEGMYDYIDEPASAQQIMIALRNALERISLLGMAVQYQLNMDSKYEIVGKSDVLQTLLNDVVKVAATEARAMITGPNGSGKELIARALHKNSKRDKESFIEVNCAAIPKDMVESELFGHKKGSFTSAIADRIGKFEAADGGTIFLDEIAEMSLAAQTKLLRVLQEKKITPVGSNNDVEVNVRVLAATNRNLIEEIEAGRFREDLYHRLNVIQLHVPGLDQRKEDIPDLVEKFLRDIAKQENSPPKRITAGAIEKLQSKHWSGNIRELRNAVERLIILGSEVINEKDVERLVTRTDKIVQENTTHLSTSR